MKLNFFFILLFVLNSFSLFAQTPYILKDEDTETISSFEVLPDENYTFQQVLMDTSLHFIDNPNVLSREQIENHDYVWMRFFIQNPSPYSKKIYIRAIPLLKNEIYAYDAVSKKWEMIEGGYEMGETHIKVAFKSIFLQPQKMDTVFIKVKISPLNTQSNIPSLFIHIQKDSYFAQSEHRIFVIWIISLVTIGAFFFYNLYVYFVFKDKTYLYYLAIITGGLIYITSSLCYFGMLFPIEIVQFYVDNNHYVQIFDINVLACQFSSCIILFGFVKFTDSYLQLPQYFKKWSKTINYMLYGYIFFTLLTSLLTISGILYLHTVFITILENIFILILTILLIGMGVLCLLKGYKEARYFLWANSSPLFMIIVITVVLINNPVATYMNVPLFSSVGLITQAIAFSVALVARVNLLKDQLQEKQFESQKLEAENEKILARNKYIELENEYIVADLAKAIQKEKELKAQVNLEIHQKTELVQKIEHETIQRTELQAKLEANQRELTANTLYLYQKNELLIHLQKQIQSLSYKETNTENKESIREIKSAIHNDIQLDNDWDNFKLHFEKVHPNFFKELNQKYPNLTKNELRLAAYYHLNMSVKEIATLLNIDPRSVHKAKSRLNKKMEAIDKELIINDKV